MAESARNNNLDAYRDLLIAAEQKMQREYDKAVMTLSGGALGVSFTLLKDVVGKDHLNHFYALLVAWIVWGLSVCFVLASFFTSGHALRRAISDVDRDAIHETLANSGWATATKILNALAGICFFIGVIFLVVFVGHNHPK